MDWGRSADPESDALFCQNRSCRGHTVVDVRRDNEKAFELEVSMAPPVVQEGIVMILAGETLYIEAREAPTRLVHLRHVGNVDEPERTLTLRLWQATETAGTDTVFEVQNPFSRPIKFVLAMQTPESDELIPAPSCAVAPGETAAEHWPHAVFQLVVSGFALLDPGQLHSCS